jgi:AcrR family transcriptional regulator
MSGKERYHHGDLRNALLQAAISLLEGEGLDGLSLRSVAARAGVSHAGPAHHFPNLKSLLTAVATVAFDRFGTTMREHRDQAAADPRSQLAAIGDAYVGFARACPQQFRLMFSVTRLDWTDEPLLAAARAAREQLTEVCGPVAELRGENSPEARQALEHLVWAAVHGHAHLLLAGQLGDSAGPDCQPTPRPDVESLLLGPKGVSG